MDCSRLIRASGGEASAHLQSLIKETGRQIDVWSANDSVDAAAHIAFGRIAGDKRFLANRASAIRCAKSAAIALLLRSDLSPEEFERLYRPFGKLIPVGDLAGSEKPATRSS